MRKNNVIKDYVAVAGQLGVTHLASFTQTDVGVNLVCLSVAHSSILKHSTGTGTPSPRSHPALPHPLGQSWMCCRVARAHQAQYTLHRDIHQFLAHPKAVRPTIYQQPPLV